MPVANTHKDQPLPGLAELFSTLEYFHPLSPEIKDYLSRKIMPCKVLKRKLLLREGEICQHVYFIRKGAIRGFFREGGKDITTWITIENEIVSSISTWEQPQPVTENIQALEDAELYMMTLSELKEMFHRFPEFNIVVRKLLQQYYADAESRAYIARLTKAENKYRYFLKKHASLANRIPLKYIASYLGMTLETLSRIRKKITHIKSA
jgi:CRP-like cAMP-binding protein